jgi:ATPase subunit of ABC transporter with duplicated ATPase domains
MILPDNETKVDLLNNEATAKTIIGLLRERPDSPVTIGVHGDWGAGKSSVLEMIAAQLDTDSQRASSSPYRKGRRSSAASIAWRPELQAREAAARTGQAPASLSGTGRIARATGG